SNYNINGRVRSHGFVDISKSFFNSSDAMLNHQSILSVQSPFNQSIGLFSKINLGFFLVDETDAFASCFCSLPIDPVARIDNSKAENGISKQCYVYPQSYSLNATS
ncbi:MAG: hypothetical protein EBT51_12835, partial [Flavobacteriaceae bacterium]|nr:hypothetical protein [Flavobacteriaceae bacterium]